MKSQCEHEPKVLVVGDLMIDEWVYGDVNRISPEAPIPIVDIKDEKKYLGGAGNVFQNLKALIAHPYIIGGVSETYDGHWIKNMVKSDSEKSWFYEIPETFVKKRICSGQQQIVRLDTGRGKSITDIEIEQALGEMEDVGIDIVIVADYGKGTITETVLNDLSDFCYRHNIKLLVDPYINDYYYGEFKCELIKFNKLEAENFTGLPIETESNLTEAGRILLNEFDSKSILLTLGPNGMAYFDREKYKKNPYRVLDRSMHVYDVCGAGDVIIAVLGYLMCYEKWDSMESILQHAARAGRIAVSKKGTSIVTFKELLGGKPIFSVKDINEMLKDKDSIL